MAENLRFAVDGPSADVGRRSPKAGREACRPASGASLARLSSHRPAGSQQRSGRPAEALGFLGAGAFLIKQVILIEILNFRQGLGADSCPTRSVRK
jgi:hypothetical protein